MSWLIRHQPVIDWATQSILSFSSPLLVEMPTISDNDASLSSLCTPILVSSEANSNDFNSSSVNQKCEVDPVCDGPASTSSLSLDSEPVCIFPRSNIPIRVSNRFSVLQESEPSIEDDTVVEHSQLVLAENQPKGFSTTKQSSRRVKHRRRLKRSSPSGTPDQGLLTETVSVLVIGSDGTAVHPISVENPPSQASLLTQLPVLHPRTFLKELKRGEGTQAR
jgi:hypothetical protein